jgi:Xaa-Pro aminopeptidase
MKIKKTSPVHLLIRRQENAADIRYLCGTEPPEAAVLIKKSGRILLLVSDMEVNRMRRCVKRGITVKTPGQIGSSWKNGPVEWIRKTVKTEDVTVDKNFPYGLAEKLKKEGFRIHLSEKPLCPRREIKHKDEVNAVRQAQRAAVTAMKAAIQTIEASAIGSGQKLYSGKTLLTSEVVRAVIGRTLLDLDCIAEETIVSCGPASADPHERGEGPLFAGQPIVIDIFPRSNKTGYWGDITRTVCRGPVPVDLKKQYNAVQAAQTAQLKALRAGVFTDTIHRIGAELMEKSGYKTETVDGTPQGFIHGTGHGVGLEIHEAPRISPATHQKLRTGHIVTIEPGLYYPKIGGVRIEDTVLITEEGYKMLSPCPKQLEG